MPADLLLHQFGALLNDVFGRHTYHVGSSLEQKTGWRDVDVRVILDDAEWERWEFGDPESCHLNAKWCSLVLAYSALGRQMTGLPIDFQIQPQTWANEKFGRKEGCQRSFLGLHPYLMRKAGSGEAA